MAGIRALEELVRSRKSARNLGQVLGQVHSGSLLAHDLGDHSLRCVAQGLWVGIGTLFFSFLPPERSARKNSILQLHDLCPRSIVASHEVLQGDDLQDEGEELIELGLGRLIVVGLPEGHQAILGLSLALSWQVKAG